MIMTRTVKITSIAFSFEATSYYPKVSQPCFMFSALLSLLITLIHLASSCLWYLNCCRTSQICCVQTVKSWQEQMSFSNYYRLSKMKTKHRLFLRIDDKSVLGEFLCLSWGPPTALQTAQPWTNYWSGTCLPARLSTITTPAQLLSRPLRKINFKNYWWDRRPLSIVFHCTLQDCEIKLLRTFSKDSHLISSKPHSPNYGD